MMSWGFGRLLAAKDERGLSTLEWILLVAAVGGLATMGVFIVRNATDATSEQVDGETDQVAAHTLDAANADMQKIILRRNTSQRDQGRKCHHGEYLLKDKHFSSAGEYVGHNHPDATMSIVDKWGELVYFHVEWRDVNGDGSRDKNNELFCVAQLLSSLP